MERIDLQIREQLTMIRQHQQVVNQLRLRKRELTAAHRKKRKTLAWDGDTPLARLVKTLVLPFEAVIPENVKAYTLTYESGDAATATQITTGTISANTPVLINATAAGNYDFKKKTDGDWAPNADAITWSGATVSNGALTGVYVQNDKSGLYNPTYYVPDDSYVLQNGTKGLGFYKVAEANKILVVSKRRAHRNVLPDAFSFKKY